MLSGGANGIRTRDPHTASVMRYQLRHSPRVKPLKCFKELESIYSEELRLTKSLASDVGDPLGKVLYFYILTVLDYARSGCLSGVLLQLRKVCLSHLACSISV